WIALSEFMYLEISAMVSFSLPAIFIKANATAAPNNSNTMDTVVEVGIPRVLKKSNNRMSVIITAIKIIMISLNMNSLGIKIPFLATSIIPLEKAAPIKIPEQAITSMVL